MSHELERLFRRIQALVRPGRAASNAVETGVIQRVQVQYNDIEVHEINSMQQYGFASSIKRGCDLMVINVAGDNANSVAIASNDQRYRPKNLTAGAVRVYNDAGSYVHIEAGQITIVAAGKVVVTSPEVTMSGKLTVQGDIVSTAGDVQAGTVSLKNHQHVNSGGSGIGGKPQQ